MELERLAGAIDELVAAGPEASGDAVLSLMRQLSRLEAVTAQAVAAFDGSREWAANGAQNAVQWLAARTHRPKGECRHLVYCGKAIRYLPAAGRAWTEGDIGAAHVRVLGRLRRPATAEALARDEELLVADAGRLRFDPFRRAVRYWEELADPDGEGGNGRGRPDKRDVYLARSFDGMYLGGMTLDAVRGEIVSGELSRLEKLLFESDWAEARRRLGRDPHPDELDRNGAQRRADALVEMATRSASARSSARRPAPLFTVLVGMESLVRTCELASGTVVTASELVPWLARADVERVVFGLPTRIEVSERSRLFKGATRRAIEVRDRQCTHPYCDRPAPECEVDHIIPWEAGGPTTQDNGRLLCGFHNRLRHKRPPDDEAPHDDAPPPEEPPPGD